jgi:hypothetical protein
MWNYVESKIAGLEQSQSNDSKRIKGDNVTVSCYHEVLDTSVFSDAPACCRLPAAGCRILRTLKNVLENYHFLKITTGYFTPRRSDSIVVQ